MIRADGLVRTEDNLRSTIERSLVGTKNTNTEEFLADILEQCNVNCLKYISEDESKSYNSNGVSEAII